MLKLTHLLQTSPFLIFEMFETKQLEEKQSAYLRQHANEVKRCEEIERHLRYFKQEIVRSRHLFPNVAAAAIANSSSSGISEDPLEQSYEAQIIYNNNNSNNSEDATADSGSDTDSIASADSLMYASASSARAIDSIDSRVATLAKEIQELNYNIEKLEIQLTQEEEFQYVLERVEKLMHLQQQQQNANDDKQQENDFASYRATSANNNSNEEDEFSYGQSTLAIANNTTSFVYLTGVMPNDRIPTLQSIGFRLTRGNFDAKFSPIEEELLDVKRVRILVFFCTFCY